MSNIDKDKVWADAFGSKTVGHDFDGQEVHKNAHGSNLKYGWDVDHINPKNGSTMDNLQVTNQRTNKAKADKTTFKIDKVEYQVKKSKNVTKDEWANNYDYSSKKSCIVIMNR